MAYAAQPVVRTYARWFHVGGDTVAMFKRIAGSDISWRQRVKRCIKCDETFHTAELAVPFLFALVDHAQNLQIINQRLDTAMADARRRELQIETERKATHTVI